MMHCMINLHNQAKPYTDTKATCVLQLVHMNDNTMSEIELLRREVAQLNKQLYAAYQRIAQLQKEKKDE